MGERPTTRRRPFAMDINEGGKELLLSEGHAPASGATLPRLGEIERTKIAIARPRSAPPRGQDDRARWCATPVTVSTRTAASEQ